MQNECFFFVIVEEQKKGKRFTTEMIAFVIAET